MAENILGILLTLETCITFITLIIFGLSIDSRYFKEPLFNNPNFLLDTLGTYIKELFDSKGILRILLGVLAFIMEIPAFVLIILIQAIVRLYIFAISQKDKFNIENMSPQGILCLYLITWLLFVFALYKQDAAYNAARDAAYDAYIQAPYDSDPTDIYLVNGIMDTVEFEEDYIYFLDETNTWQKIYYDDLDVEGTEENPYVEIYIKSDSESEWDFRDMTLVKVYIKKE